MKQLYSEELHKMPDEPCGFDNFLCLNPRYEKHIN